MKKIILDKYEQEIENAIKEGEYISVSKKQLAETKKMLEEAAKNYFELKSSKRITLRVKNEDLIRVKAKARSHGLPYQRLIGMLLKEYADEKIRIAI